MDGEELRIARSQKSEVRLRSKRGSFRLRFATVEDSTRRADRSSDCKSEDRNQKSEVRGQRSEVRLRSKRGSFHLLPIPSGYGGQVRLRFATVNDSTLRADRSSDCKSEDGGQKSEVPPSLKLWRAGRGQKTEVRRQRTEIRGRRSEVGRRRSEGRSQRSDHPTPSTHCVHRKIIRLSPEEVVRSEFASPH